MKNELTDKGLTGNSGFIDGMHIAAPYDSNGKVFVESGDSWERIELEKAKPNKIIRCHFCDDPAITLDHYYPCYTDRNRCEKHLKKDI